MTDFDTTSENNYDFHVQVSRNLSGIECEKQGDIQKAIELYEQNAAECFEGTHPYDRLAVIYRRQKLYKDEIRVLEQAINVFENKAYIGLEDMSKLQRFKERLEKAKILAVKNTN